MSARGVAVANSASAKARGVRGDAVKSTAEKDVVPEVTSGTEERVLEVAEQVTVFWRDVAIFETSVGRGVVPIIKQGWVWRVRMMGGFGRADVRARLARRVARGRVGVYILGRSICVM